MPIQIYILAFVVLAALAIIGFLILHELKNKLDPKKLRVFILDRVYNLRKKYVTVESDGGSEFFSFNEITYEVHRSRVYREGRFRIPTSFYEEGKKKPLKLRQNERDTDEHEGADYYVVQKHNFARQLIAAFRPESISAQQSLVIIVGAVAVVGIALYYMLGQRIDGLYELLTQLNGMEENGDGS